MKIKVKEKELELEGFFYNVKDFMLRDRTSLALILYDSDEDGTCEYGRLTTGFGEFIGMKGTTYINGNGIFFDPEQVMIENGLGIQMGGIKKQSGFCEYPLYLINPYLLEKIYKKDELCEYLGYYRFMNEHILNDEEYENDIAELKASYDEYYEKCTGKKARHNF